MQVLNDHQIKQKIKRISYEILENHHDDEGEIILAGINNNGFGFAQLLHDSLAQISDRNFVLSRIQLNPARPLENPITTNLPKSDIENKSIIIIDDVANTGRTIFYACKVYMDVLTNRIEVAVMVDRKHKQFPIKVDYVGLSLATTVQENIKATLSPNQELSVSLS